MNDEPQLGSTRAKTWLDAFPWLEAVGAEDDPAQHSSAWWRDRIDQSSSGQRHQRVGEISVLAVRQLRGSSIGSMLPGLTADTNLQDLPLDPRSRNVLARIGARTTGDLLSVRVADFFGMAQVGVGIVDKILRCLIDAAADWARREDSVDSAPQRSDREFGAPVALWVVSLLRDVRVLAHWRAVLGLPDDPLFSGLTNTPTPPQIIEARQRIERLSATQVLVEGEHGLDVADRLDRAFRRHDDRTREVLVRRTFSGQPDTLAEVGHDLGLTRERVRQLEAKARAQILEELASSPVALLRTAMRDLIDPVLPLRDLLDQLPVLARPVPSVLQPAWRVIERLDDAYQVSGEWCAAPTIRAATARIRTEVRELADAHGVTRLADIGFASPNAANSRQHDVRCAWLRHCGFVVDGSDVLSRPHVFADRVAAVLRARKEPISVRALLEELGGEGSLRYLRATLGRDERFEYLAWNRWALTEWTNKPHASSPRGGGRSA